MIKKKTALTWVFFKVPFLFQTAYGLKTFISSIPFALYFSVVSLYSALKKTAARTHFKTIAFNMSEQF